MSISLVVRMTAVAALLSGVALAGTSGVITVTGSVAEDCNIVNFPSSVDLGDLQQSASEVISFDFNCNAPFAYTLSSTNGALAHTIENSVPGFLTSLDYSVTVSLPTDAGTGILQTITSNSVGPGGTPPTFNDSGNEIALNSVGQLTLQWSAPGIATSTPMLAGNYADSLTLTISTQP